MYKPQWKVVQPNHGHHISLWPTHSHEGNDVFALADAVSIAQTLGDSWKIYHAHGEYPVDPYAIIDPARYGSKGL
jgi:hypothetical protein